MGSSRKDSKKKRGVSRGAGSSRETTTVKALSTSGGGIWSFFRNPVRWYLSRNPIFRFVSSLAILMIVANIVLITKPCKEQIIPQYLRGWAQMSCVVLNVFGEEAKVSDSSVWSRRYSVNIKRGCDALQPTVLFISAVVASPVGGIWKLPGLGLGLLFLMGMNLVRVVSLFYIGIHWPSVFEIMHEEVWQVTFIILSIFAWAFWAIWAVKRTNLTLNAVR